ncbi:hypothetical protein QYE76_026905 [Lolium multiflorum]|uniref:Uncharacterized protein n=1 Tax=Lolium multiflorum TaxID=4521 RepID=A0AAD8RL95_LOLMU|nr:hypothetical protein QYE76_026905 [Lolium multiflorum]
MARAVLMAAIMAMVMAPAAMAMDFTAADLASENAATWALYHRWSARYSVASDKARRFAVFRHNLLRALNSSSSINHFGDLTDEELAEPTNLPYGVNWAGMGLDGSPPAVSSVKDLHSRGSCEGPAAAAAVEGLHAIQTKTLAISLSEQQIVDCDTSSNGCTNGWGRAAMAHQPVVVTVDASGNAFKKYDGGVFRGPCDNNGGGHQMTAVGYSYNLITHETYWTLKNSWGRNWGEKQRRSYVQVRGATAPPIF